MAQLVKVDEAAIHDDSPLVLGHRKDIEFDLGRLTVLQNIGLDVVADIWPTPGFEPSRFGKLRVV